MLTLLWIFLLISVSSEKLQKITLDGNKFVDVDGRQHLFHGVNAIYKEFPWMPSRGAFDPKNSLGPEDIANLRHWGFNVVRLGVMWPGVETGPGQYNSTYLSEMVKLVNDLGDAGIYTIVDMHQDLGNRYFCGEGIPDFYVEALMNDPNSSLAQGRDFPIGYFSSSAYIIPEGQKYPSLDDCLSKQFANYYFTDKVGRLFQTLYTPGTDLHSGFIGVWQAIADAFKENPNVLGYELLNEPWFGDVISDPTLLVSEETDKNFLQPLYIETAKTIFSRDTEATILYEEPPFSVRFPGFTTPPINGRSIFSYHIYCGASQGKVTCDTVELGLEDKFQHWLQETGYAAFMTEFGAVDNGTESIKKIAYLIDLADKHIQSWSYWQMKYFGDITTSNALESFYDANGHLETNKVKMLTRTFPHVVAGNITTTYFDRSTGDYTLTFSPAGDGISVVHVSSLWYPNNLSIQVDNTCVSFLQPDNDGYIILESKGCTSGEIKVVISAEDKKVIN